MKMTLNEEIEYLQSGNWYDKVRAVLPTDEYLKLGWAIGAILETLELFRSLAPEPQTNADRIRSMSDEELLDFMKKSVANAYMCKIMRTEPMFLTLEWLQQPAKEDT